MPYLYIILNSIINTAESAFWNFLHYIFCLKCKPVRIKSKKKLPKICSKLMIYSLYTGTHGIYYFTCQVISGLFIHFPLFFLEEHYSKKGPVPYLYFGVILRRDIFWYLQTKFRIKPKCLLLIWFNIGQKRNSNM